IKKYYSNLNDQDDLISIGTIGLIKAVNTFDSSKGIRLSSYAARCIENEVLMFFRSSKKSAQDISMNEPIDTDKDGNALTLMDVMATEDNILEDLDCKIKSEQLKRYIFEVLSPRERTIIELRYGLTGLNPLTQREVAKKLGISRSYVSRIEKKSLGALYKRFTK
ncbi:MAG: sigK, partial [Caproiciproducens sp.]|nr:sigK [Caproiciproducens sp.]